MAQNITLNPIDPKVSSNGVLTFAIDYSTDNVDLAVFNPSVHYVDSQLTFVSAVPNSLAENFFQGAAEGNDVLNGDNNATTDKIVTASFVDTTAPNNFPGGSGEVKPLVTYTFQLKDGVTVDPLITFTAEGSPGQTVTVPSGGQPITIGINTAPPNAVNDAGTTDEDTILNVDAPGVLRNDTDADNDPLTVTAVNGAAASVGQQITLASGALLTLNANGSYTYNPNGAFEDLNDGQTATDSFTYNAFDGTENSNEATVTLTIDGVSDQLPFFNNDQGLVVVEAGQTISVALAKDVESESTRDSLLGYYRVDDLAGTIDGTAPGDSQYAAKAILSAKETDFILRGGTGGNTAAQGFEKTLGEGIYAPFVLVNGGELNNLTDFLEINAANKTNGDIDRTVAYFAFSGANPDKVDHFAVGDDGSTLKAEDWFGGGDLDFNPIADIQATFALV